MLLFIPSNFILLILLYTNIFFFFFGFSCKELPVAHIDPRNQVLGDGLLRVNILFQERVGKEWDVFNDTE